ncbi:hypothetical protein HPC37_02560 [Pasteurellaceae bacterium 20609_3]|nr:hypothetical protein [Spirabiliibacterium mucosae]MBE2897739.1 hypothetical protein [Spirabiliibacterium mucosae]
MTKRHRTFAKMPHWWLFGGCDLKVTLAKHHNSHQQIANTGFISSL